MWLSIWSEAAGVAMVGTAAYLTVLLVLRFSGKRNSGVNASDFDVTVALVSTLATTLLTSEVSLAEGAVRTLSAVPT